MECKNVFSALKDEYVVDLDKDRVRAKYAGN